MGHTPRSETTAVFLLILAFTLTSCGSGGGPLDANYSPGALCAPIGKDRRITVGLDTLENSGQANAVISEVELVHPDAGLTLIEASIVVAGFTLVGVRSGYPPALGELPDNVEWAEAQPMPGAVVTPQDATTGVFNLVVGLELAGSVTMARADGFRIMYESGGRDYEYVTPNSIELKEGPCGVDEQ